jgi:hypothetical protein
VLEKIIYVVLLSCAGCSTNVMIIHNCCLDPRSCIEMEQIKGGYTYGELLSVSGNGCDKKVKVRMYK